jgi:hypothetical protein
MPVELTTANARQSLNAQVAALGLPRDEYYTTLCELADELAGSATRPEQEMFGL